MSAIFSLTTFWGGGLDLGEWCWGADRIKAKDLVETGKGDTPWHTLFTYEYACASIFSILPTSTPRKKPLSGNTLLQCLKHHTWPGLYDCQLPINLKLKVPNYSLIFKSYESRLTHCNILSNALRRMLATAYHCIGLSIMSSGISKLPKDMATHTTTLKLCFVYIMLTIMLKHILHYLRCRHIYLGQLVPAEIFDWKPRPKSKGKRFRMGAMLMSHENGINQ